MDQQEYEIYQALGGDKGPEGKHGAPKKEPERAGAFRRGLIAGVLITAAAAALLFLGWSIKTGGLKNDISTDDVLTSSTATKLQELEGLISRYYLHDYTTEDLQEGLYAGLVSGLGDKYSTYYNADETEALNEMTSGTYSGIGAVMQQNLTNGTITLLTIYEDSPAEEAGLKDGDILYKIDGNGVAGRDLTDVVKDIKGDEGTQVEIAVYRDGNEIDVTAVRRMIKVKTVSYKMMNNNIGYIKVTEFEEVTLEQFQEALADLKSQGMTGMVIDLRDNPGGNVSTVCDMLDELLPEGLIVYTEDKNGTIKDYKSTGEDTLGMPLTVLVNENSASASEIFSGAVQDRGIGTVVGKTTYGKGVVQSIIDLQDGTSLKITIAEYYTPNGRNIDGIGIKPDVEIENDTTNDVSDDTGKVSDETDEQLQKALEIIRDEQ